jgi:hypothetical protein
VKFERNRYLWWPLAGAATFLFLAAALVFTSCWPVSFVFLYAAVLLACCAKRERRVRRRRELERHWWARQRAGIPQAPLRPCCLGYDETSVWHDPFCTRNGSRSRMTQECVDEKWRRLVAFELCDLESGEEA